MKLCSDTITIFNKRIDTENGWDTYIPTIITGVSWYGDVATNLGEKGLNAANLFKIRIPIDADFSEKTYVTPNEYAEETIISGIFTIANGDVIVKDAVTDSTLTPAELKEKYPYCCTVLGVTDNRRAPNAKHFKVVGK